MNNEKRIIISSWQSRNGYWPGRRRRRTDVRIGLALVFTALAVLIAFKAWW